MTPIISMMRKTVLNEGATYSFAIYVHVILFQTYNHLNLYNVNGLQCMSTFNVMSIKVFKLIKLLRIKCDTQVTVNS